MALSALRSGLACLMLFTLLGLVLACMTAWTLRDDRFWATISGVAAFLEALFAGAVVGVKRGLGVTIIEGVRQFSLGRVFLGQLFSRLLKMPEAGTHGERGNAAAKSLERVPLAQAEAALGAAIQSLAPPDDAAGGLQNAIRRRLHQGLARWIRRLTLARFRAADAQHGGVDLKQVESELEATIDETLARRVGQGMRLWTALALVVLPLTVATQTWLLLALRRGHGG